MLTMVRTTSIVSIFLAALFVVGCTSRPSEDEMRRLNELKSQVAGLERQVSDKQREKTALERELADKNAKLKDCQADQAAARESQGK